MAGKTVSLNTVIGSMELPFEVKITNPLNGKVVYALSHNISDFAFGSDIFSYKHSGFIIVRDEVGVQLGLDDVPKVGPLKISITINDKEYEEEYISSGVTATKTDTSSKDVLLRIDFINSSSVKIDQAYVRCKADKNQKVSDFLKDKFESIGLKISPDEWMGGDMKFSEPHFFLGTLSDIINEIKAMDMKRDTGNLFMCYSNLDGYMCYSEITDKIRKASADKTNLLLIVGGGRFSSGGILSPSSPAAWSFTSTDLDSLIHSSSGFKFYQYNRHKKLMIPRPDKEGLTSADILKDVPYVNEVPIVDNGNTNEAINEYIISSGGDEERVTDYTDMGKHALSRDVALNDWFNNNVYNVKVGLIDTDLDINRNVGIKIENIANEPFNRGLCGDWLLAGVKHCLTKTQATTDLYLIRNSIQS